MRALTRHPFSKNPHELNKKCADALREYLAHKARLKNDSSFRYWVTNENFCVHLTFWFWFFWQMWVMFSMIHPRNIGNRAGRSQWETVFYWVPKQGVGVTTQFAETVSYFSTCSWFLLSTGIVMGLSIFSFCVIKNFLYDVKTIVKEFNSRPLFFYLRNKTILISFFIFIATINSFVTAMSLLYVDVIASTASNTPPTINTLLFNTAGWTAEKYTADFTTLGWVCCGTNVVFIFLIFSLYYKFYRQKCLHNHFFFDPLREKVISEQDVKARNSHKTKRTKWKSENILVPNADGYIAELKDVWKIYKTANGNFYALKNINLRIKKGDFICIVGPSGSGKTTLMNLLSAIDKPTKGSVILRGHNINAMTSNEMTTFRRINVGYIFQNYALMPNLNVQDNIKISEHLLFNQKKEQLKTLFWDSWKKADTFSEKRNLLTTFLKTVFPGSKTSEEVRYLMDVLELSKHIHKFPHQLSGGQQQRVAIARSLIKKPTLLFGDEPTGAIDHNMTKFIVELFCMINKYSKTTVIIITHNPALGQVANRVLHIKKGEIVKDITNFSPKEAKDIEGL